MKIAYRTEQAWGNLTEWHSAPDLVVDLSDGQGQTLEALYWRNQDGSAGSISFQSDLSEFLGYYQKAEEGPIAYRGHRK